MSSERDVVCPIGDPLVINTIARRRRDHMDRHSIGLRAANPTFDEGLAFARYADEVAEGFFRLMLGRRAEQILARGVRPARPRPLLPARDVRRT